MLTFAKQSDVWRDNFIAMAESLNNLFLLFIVSSNRNRSALLRKLLCNNSLCVGQLYEDKSLWLRARDLIFFTNDHQTVNYYNNSLLELIYFLNKNSSQPHSYFRGMTSLFRM